MTSPIDSTRSLECTICSIPLAQITSENEREVVAWSYEDIALVERCSHIFHRRCILLHAERRNQCPSCNMQGIRGYLYSMDFFNDQYKRFLTGDISRAEFLSTTHMTRIHVPSTQERLEEEKNQELYSNVIFFIIMPLIFALGIYLIKKNYPDESPTAQLIRKGIGCWLFGTTFFSTLAYTGDRFQKLT